MSNNEEAQVESEEQAVAEEMTAVSKHIAKMKEMLRRPDAGQSMPLNVVRMLVQDFAAQKQFIEVFAAHLRAMDRKRLNGVGIKRQGFAERAFMLAKENPEYLPHWLTIGKFTNDHELFAGLRTALDNSEQVNEMMTNLVMEAADMLYTDGLEFYYPVKEAAKRRVDAAESLYKELFEFFKKFGKKSKDEPTEKEIRRDVNALLKGTKDGKIVIENVSPKLTGGTHRVVDNIRTGKVAVEEIEKSS